MLDFEELRRKRKQKLEYYRNNRKQGKKLYNALDAGDRCCNTEKERGKRRYGFRRSTVNQMRRLPKDVVDWRRRKKIKCYSFNSYISTRKINKFYSDENLNQLMGYLYIFYNDPIPLLEDYRRGFRDPLFTKIVSITGVRKDIQRMDIFMLNFRDLFVDSLIEFITKVDNYVPETKVAFYSYMINIIPYRFSSLFSILLKNQSESLEVDNIVDETYDIEFDVNILGAYTLSKFKKIKL